MVFVDLNTISKFFTLNNFFYISLCVRDVCSRITPKLAIALITQIKSAIKAYCIITYIL